MTHPPVDIVVPFVGSDAELEALLGRLGALRLGPADTVCVVDNRPGRPPGRSGPVLRAPERQSSYFARNRGAAAGNGEWILYLDADIELPPDLVERYFDPLPQPDTGLLIGAIETTVDTDGLVARYGLLRNHLGNEHVSAPGLEYAQTASAGVRRDAFEAIGGFTETVRSAGDADLSFRLRAAGYGFERRPEAVVAHPTRPTLKKMLRQFLRYGSGSQWLRPRYPEFAPPTPLARVAYWLAAAAVRAPWLALRGHRDEALRRALDPVVVAAYELGRFVPNEVESDRRHALRHVAAVLRDRRTGPPARA